MTLIRTDIAGYFWQIKSDILSERGIDFGDGKIPHVYNSIAFIIESSDREYFMKCYMLDDKEKKTNHRRYSQIKHFHLFIAEYFTSPYNPYGR